MAMKGEYPLAKKRKNERGVALILVMSMIAIIATLASDAVFESEITSRSSVGERDKTRAEMAALTGAQFAKMLLSLDTFVESQPPPIKSAIKGQLGGKPLYTLLDGLPIGEEAFDSAGDLTSLNLSALMDADLVQALKNVPGYFVVKVTNESGKLNLNLLDGIDKRAMQDALKRLFSQKREAKFLEEKGYTPEQLMANLTNYRDSNTTGEGGESEEAAYQKLKFLHKPKNGPFQSLEELRRVPGFNDDEIYNLFAPYFTVWPIDQGDAGGSPHGDGLLDINEISIELLAALVTKEGTEVNEAEFDKLEDSRSEGGKIITLDEKGQFKKGDLTAKLKELGGGTDPGGITTLFGAKSNVFKVEVRGVSRGIERTYVMVLDRTKRKGKVDEPPLRIVYQRFI